MRASGWFCAQRYSRRQPRGADRGLSGNSGQRTGGRPSTPGGGHKLRRQASQHLQAASVRGLAELCRKAGSQWLSDAVTLRIEMSGGDRCRRRHRQRLASADNGHSSITGRDVAHRSFDAAPVRRRRACADLNRRHHQRCRAERMASRPWRVIVCYAGR